MFGFEWKTVMEHEAGVLYKDGALTEVLGPGRRLINTKRERLVKLDTRENMIQVPGQEITLRDGLAPRITWSGRYKIADPKVYVRAAESPYTLLYYDLQMAIREVVEGLDYDELIAQKMNLGEDVLKAARVGATKIGIELTDGQIRDITLSGEFKRALAEEKKAQILARAGLERARAEAATLRSLANSARMLESNPALMQLRMIHAFEQGKGSLVLNSFPGPVVPMEEPRRSPSGPDDEVL